MASCARRAGLGLAWLLVAAPAIAGGTTAWFEEFPSGQLDAERWQRTLDGDFRTQSAEVVLGRSGYRLRIAADTRGTRDDTLKHVGVVSRCAMPFGPDARVRVRIDWGPPANGSYFTGALVLSPHATTGDPGKTDDYLSVGYVGVPPGRNARLLVTARVRGVVRTLFADGWPDANRAGRPVARSELEVVRRGALLEVREEGRLVYTGRAVDAPYDAAYIYLQLTSHSNFAERALHFEDVQVTDGGNGTTMRPFPAAPACASTAASGR